MAPYTVQLVLQYDGTHFSGWQRQPDERTVQAVLEDSLLQLCGTHVSVLGSGRTDAGVHALGQAAGVRVSERWTPRELRRALNAVLPDDVWVAGVFPMRDDFHARYSAVSRAYRYLVGTDDAVQSPFRRGRELAWRRQTDPAALNAAARHIVGRHCFRGFAVKGTAPAGDDHRCLVREASWSSREGGLAFTIRANRFLHHMVRFLVGTMLDISAGRRDPELMAELLAAGDNVRASPPAPPHGLYLEEVEYPHELYLADA